MARPENTAQTWHPGIINSTHYVSK